MTSPTEHSDGLPRNIKVVGSTPEAEAERDRLHIALIDAIAEYDAYRGDRMSTEYYDLERRTVEAIVDYMVADKKASPSGSRNWTAFLTHECNSQGPQRLLNIVDDEMLERLACHKPAIINVQEEKPTKAKPPAARRSRSRQKLGQVMRHRFSDPEGEEGNQ